MDAREMPTTTELTEALPAQGFDFYHLGQVLPEAPGGAPEDLADLRAMAFTLQGESRGVFAVAFDRALDASTYTELGNVLASRFADGLSRARGHAVLISPPRELEGSRLAALAALSRGPVIRRAYLHVHNGVAVRVEALILPVPSEGTANA
jgi:hypothetical protein